MRRALAAWVLAAASLVIACSRSEAGPSPVQQSAEPLALTKPREPASANPTPGAATAATSGTGGTAGASPAVTSFLEPVGMPMSASMAAAAGWLEALRDRDEVTLNGATSLPFEWLQTEGGNCNVKQPVTTAKEFSTIIGCLLADMQLRRALTAPDRAGIAELPIEHLQDWAQPWRARAPTGAVLVNAFIKRSDMRLDMDLWVHQGSVRALWTHLEDGAPQVGLARSWLDALQRRDLKALASATSYPFEVRDSGREAPCGKRDAVKPAALEAAVQCLFDNTELIQALQNRAPFVEAAGEPASIPNWAERWWQAGKHAGLRKVSAGVSNPSSCTFDIVMMVAPDGVRAFWKHGSVESRD